MKEALARSYRDLHDHIAELEAQGLLNRIDRQIDKDAEMHPLVRLHHGLETLGSLAAQRDHPGRCNCCR